MQNTVLVLYILSLCDMNVRYIHTLIVRHESTIHTYSHCATWMYDTYTVHTVQEENILFRACFEFFPRWDNDQDESLSYEIYPHSFYVIKTKWKSIITNTWRFHKSLTNRRIPPPSLKKSFTTHLSFSISHISELGFIIFWFQSESNHLRYDSG
jgi:hypothetical protein